MNTKGLERNIILYRWYIISTSILPWIPVFFLYFSQSLPLQSVIQLGAIYYLAVVVCEVPSGYFSDKLGRKPTLILSAIFLLLSYFIFAFTEGFWFFMLGEIFLAAGIAFKSGSDTALLYDSLAKLNRVSEYASLEASTQKYGLLVLSLSCFAGGFLGSLELVYPYIASIFAALATLAITLYFVEPDAKSERSQKNIIQQITIAVSYLKDRQLAWLMFFFLTAYGLAHIAYEFYQPYIRLLDTGKITAALQSDSAPLVSGVVIGMSQFGGAMGAAMSIKLLKWLGLKRLLISCTLVQSLVIGGLAIILHPVMLLVVMLRNFPMAATRAPRLAAIGPKINSAHRATYLSIESLSARLFLSIALFGLTQLVSDDLGLQWSSLSMILGVSAVVGLCAVSILVVTSKSMTDR